MKSESRITIDPLVMGGRPTIRKVRFTVVQVLELLAGGMSTDEILADYPYLEVDDIYACLQYAVKATSSRQVMSFA